MVPDKRVADRAELGVRLWSTLVHAVDGFEAHIGRYGMSSGRFGVLLTLLAADGRLIPSQIAERLSVTRPTVTSLVHALASDGMVERHADASSLRNRPVALTAKGRRTMEAAAEDHFRRIAGATASLSKAERELLETALPLIERYCAGLLEQDSERPTP